MACQRLTYVRVARGEGGGSAAAGPEERETRQPPPPPSFCLFLRALSLSARAPPASPPGCRAGHEEIEILRERREEAWPKWGEKKKNAPLIASETSGGVGCSSRATFVQGALSFCASTWLQRPKPLPPPSASPLPLTHCMPHAACVWLLSGAGLDEPNMKKTPPGLTALSLALSRAHTSILPHVTNDRS